MKKMIIFLLSFLMLLALVFGQATTSKPKPKPQEKAGDFKNVTFWNALQNRNNKLNPPLAMEDFCPQDKNYNQKVLIEYGAIYVGKNTNAPRQCIFSNEDEVQTFQSAVMKQGVSQASIGGVRVELQPKALEALLQAVKDAQKEGLSITPRGGLIASRRSYEATVSLWNGRVNNGLDHWVKKKRLAANEAKRIRTSDTLSQMSDILSLEDRGIFFSTDFSKSILYSVAAPGASQHNTMLAFDVTEFSNARVREILAGYGWFQTVKSDLPHFTYLGLKESELKSRGLKSVKVGSQVFWIPNMDANNATVIR